MILSHSESPHAAMKSDMLLQEPYVVAYHAAHHGHHKILIRTVDTDVVVLTVSVAQGLGPEYEL